MLPVSTMTAKAEGSSAPYATWASSDFTSRIYLNDGDEPRTIRNIKVTGKNCRLDNFSFTYILMGIGDYGSYIDFEDAYGGKIEKIIIYFLTPQDDSQKVTSDGWKYSSDNKELIWEGESSATSVRLARTENDSVNLSPIKVEFYLEDTKITPTADDFSYENSTGLVSAQTGVDLGTVTTYYKVNGTWTAAKPTAVGTYDVGVVSAGSDIYEAIGSATEPFTASWTYEVKASGSGTDASGSNTKDTSGKETITTDSAAATTTSSGTTSTTASTSTTPPKTGDASSVALCLVILMAGIAGCAGVIVRRRKEF